MMRRPVSQVDPRFKEPKVDWAGGTLITSPQAAFLPPPVIGMWDSSIRQVTYPHLVDRPIPRIPVRLYIPKGTP